MKQGGQAQERTVTFDDPAFVLGIGVALYLACWAAWYFWHTPIATTYVYLRYVELWALHALGSLNLPGAAAVHEWLQRLCEPEGLVGTCRRDFSTVTWRDIASSSVVMNLGLWTLLVGLCARWFVQVNATHPKLKYAKTHTLESFVRENTPLYPHLRLFSALDLIEQPLDHPVFGMALTSRQFVYQHGLISGWQEDADGSWTPTLDRVKAARVFRAQLGRHWTKSTDLSPGETLLCAIAMPRVAATDATLDDARFKAALRDSDALIAWCWSQFTPPTGWKKPKDPAATSAYNWLTPVIDLGPARAVIANYIGHPNVKAILQRHAFNRTVIIALFMQARRLGVLPPADLRWLRFYDRALWYLLQTIGRQAGFAEAAAALSHYLYEAKAGAALAEPQLDKAIDGLEHAMTRFKYLTADKERYQAMTAGRSPGHANPIS